MLHLIALAVMAPQTKVEGPLLKVTMQTGKVIEIRMDSKNTPQTTKRIVELAKTKFYDKQRFHRVEHWVVQWGDPASKTKEMTDSRMGSGGSGKNVPFEAGKLSFKRGTVGIASVGKKIGGDSQLFVVKKDSDFLDGDYSACGVVEKGMETIDALKVGDRIKSIAVLAAKKPNTK